MAVDLTADINGRAWHNACIIAGKARMKGLLNDWEANFVKDMIEEYQQNGSMMEPTRKQFECLKEIARANESAVK